ncbi:hypothetical protein [Rhodoblastus sp.]|jgi:hypothetical protein|uniref:hypothetical protein n=1 Tax=Rhodoblastus sp. TaxID=1962975 RepID=UPI0025D8407E|nr:hypothetical protein [Rhodoblastus sp.]
MTSATLPLTARSPAGTIRQGAWTPAAAALLLFALTLASPAILNDGDTFWHIAAGDWILDHRAVPTTDPFTFSFGGAPWTAHEWLSEVLLALCFRLGGWSGVVVLTSSAVAATLFIFMRRLARDLHGFALLCLAALGFSLVTGSMLARPHVLALPALAALAAGLFSARDKEKAPSLALLPVMTIWSNLHGSFIVGLALIGPFALEAVLAARPEKRIAAARGWIVFGLLALGSALINPLGLEALLFPIRLMGLKSLAGVGEWRPEAFDHVGPLEIALFALIGFALLRPLRVAPVRLLLLIGLIHLALHHTRHGMLLGLLAPMILARPIAEALAQTPAPLAQSPDMGRLITRLQAALALALFVVLAGLRLAIPVTREDGPMAPISALAAVPAELRARPVLNHYDFGGYLIFSGVRPYIDGRTDLFGDAFLDNFDRIAAGNAKALDAAVEKDAIVWTIFPPASPVVRTLDARPGWNRIYADRNAVIHARADALPFDLRK